jgi:putative transposase
VTEYRRFEYPGATWFFTVNLAERRNNRLLIDRIDLLREAFLHVKNKYPYQIDAAVILPEHLHCILTLPEGDSDFSTRWGLIKAYFSRHIEKGERVSRSRKMRGERGLWQRRFWEHLIRDETDFRRHVDYIHWNPVKHCWVKCVKDWPHSSFHSYVRRGIYPMNWGIDVDVSGITAGE